MRWPLVLLFALLLGAHAAHAGGNPRLYGHRGASAVAPANSLLAFARARKAGADGIELDVRLTRDGHIVVFHDADVVLPSGRRAAIAELNLADLAAVDLGQGQRIPTLAQVFDALGPAMRVNVEIKAESYRTRGLERKVVDLVRARGLGPRVIFSSFNPITMRRLARLAPDIDRAILVAPGLRGRLAPRIARATAIHPAAAMTTPARVSRWLARGFREVNVWTVNDAAQIRRFARMGVSGIITDDPARARKALARNRGRARR